MVYRIGFVIEQVLGHVTHGQNLQVNVSGDPSIEAFWGLPAWDVPGLPGKVPNWTLRAGLQARRAVGQMQQEGRLDALFFHTQITAVLCQKWLKRIPSVVSLDATPRQFNALGAFYAHSTGPRWLEAWKWRLDHNCFLAARHLVTWSQWAKDGLVAEYSVPPEKVSVIPPGVDTQAWASPSPRCRHDGPVRILFVGADLERKGGLLLLQAWRALKETATVPTELHLVTRQPVAAEPGLFVYHDMAPNSAPLKQLYYECDIFCLPTYGDCLPMVLSEAGAAGLPVVSTNVAAIPEIVHQGKTGFLVPTGDVTALAAALRPLVDHPDLRRRLGETAVAVVEREFDARRNAVHLLSLIKETVHTAAGRA